MLNISNDSGVVQEKLTWRRYSLSARLLARYTSIYSKQKGRSENVSFATKFRTSLKMSI